MKKLVAIIIVSVLAIWMVTPAMAISENATAKITGAELLSVRTVSNEEAASIYLQSIGSEVDAIPYGTGIPTSSQDLTYGSYYFSADTTHTAIYSNFYFIGHNGSVDFDFYIDSMSGPGDFILRVFEKNYWNTKIYDAGVPRLVYQNVVIEDIDPDAKIYFVIIPDGVRTVLTESCRIKKHI